MAILKVADYYNCGVLERQTGNVAIYPENCIFVSDYIECLMDYLPFDPPPSNVAEIEATVYRHTNTIKDAVNTTVPLKPSPSSN